MGNVIQLFPVDRPVALRRRTAKAEDRPVLSVRPPGRPPLRVCPPVASGGALEGLGEEPPMRIRHVTRALGAAALTLTVMTTATACSDEPEQDTPGDVEDEEDDGGAY